MIEMVQEWIECRRDNQQDWHGVEEARSQVPTLRMCIETAKAVKSIVREAAACRPQPLVPLWAALVASRVLCLPETFQYQFLASKHLHMLAHLHLLAPVLLSEH
jgi:hypothetical protein